MFSRPAFTCNFWGPWEGRTRLSPLPATILARPATASEQNLRVQKELVQHRAAWPRFWTLWWRKLAPVGETNSEGGWETRSESDSECDWAASLSPPPASAAVLHAEARSPPRSPSGLPSGSHGITVHGANNNHVQLPNPRELIQRIYAPVSPPPSVAAARWSARRRRRRRWRRQRKEASGRRRRRRPTRRTRASAAARAEREREQGCSRRAR